MFDDCKTVLQILQKARALKESGEDEAKVNKLAKEKRIQLVSEAASVGKFEKILVDRSLGNLVVKELINFEMEDIDSPVVSINANGTVII